MCQANGGSLPIKVVGSWCILGEGALSDTFFIAKIFRLTGTLTYVCLCFCELLDNVSRSAALLLAFVAYLPVLYHGQKPSYPKIPR